jgi:hypothetical protein
MQLSQLTLEPHSLCYTCWVRVCIHTCLSTLLFSWISSTAAQCLATWRITSAATMTSRRLSPSRCPCGAQFYMYLFYASATLETDSWFGCNKRLHLWFILMFYVICVMISWWFCCIYAWLDPGAYMIARFMFFINRVWQHIYFICMHVSRIWWISN